MWGRGGGGGGVECESVTPKERAWIGKYAAKNSSPKAVRYSSKLLD